MIYEFQCNGDARHFDGILHAISLGPFLSTAALRTTILFSVIIDCLVDLYATAGQ